MPPESILKACKFQNFPGGMPQHHALHAGYTLHNDFLHVISFDPLTIKHLPMPLCYSTSCTYKQSLKKLGLVEYTLTNGKLNQRLSSVIIVNITVKVNRIR